MQDWHFSGAPVAAAHPTRSALRVSPLIFGSLLAVLAGVACADASGGSGIELTAEKIVVESIRSHAELQDLLSKQDGEAWIDSATVDEVTAQTLRLYASMDDWGVRQFEYSVVKMDGGDGLVPIVVETTPQTIRSLLEGLRIPIDAEEASRISSAFRVAVESPDAVLGPDATAVEVEQAADSLWTLSSRLLGARQEAIAEVDLLRHLCAANGGLDAWEQAKSVQIRVDAIRRLLMKSISAATTMEERHFDDLRVQYLSRLSRMQNDASSAVAILVSNGSDGAFRFGGSGFVYRDCVVTCVHLFSLEDTRMNGERRGLNTDRIRVVPIDWLGGSTPNARLTLSGDSFLSPEHDVAAIRLAEPSTDQEREWRDAIRERVARGTLAYGSAFDARMGVLYGFGALPDSTPDGLVVRARWIPFGRIVFPHLVCPRVHDFDPSGNLVDTRPDQWYARAFAQTLIGDPIRICEAYAMEHALSSLDAVYDACADGALERTCRFRQTINPRLINTQIATQADFREFGRFPCFGTDLATSSGLSGAPLFLMNPDGRSELVAIHHGRASAIESDEPQQRSLGNAGIAIPLSVFIKELDAWIESSGR